MRLGEEWCVEWRVARETRDWAVRQGILTENDAAAITFAHGNAGTAVQAPTGHRVILPGPPPSSDQLCAAVVVWQGREGSGGSSGRGGIVVKSTSRTLSKAIFELKNQIDF